MSAIYERTLVILKPDCIERGLMLDVLTDLCYEPIKARLFRPFRDIWSFHYHEHVGKDFYDRLVAQMQSGPIFAMTTGGVDAINLVRERTKYIREKYGSVGPRNLIHSSDGPDSARYELNLWEQNL